MALGIVKSLGTSSGLNIGRGASNVASIHWEGIDKVIKNINKEIEKLEKVTVQGLLEAALLVKGDAQRITPVDTGNLKASAYVIWGGGKSPVKSQSNPTFSRSKGRKGSAKRFAKVAGMQSDIAQHNAVLNQRKKPSTNLYAEVGFTARYALQVHERTGASHVKRGKVKLFGKNVNAKLQIGQAKFLEQAFVQNRNKILAIIIRRARIK